MFLNLLRSSTSLPQIHQIQAQILVHSFPLQSHLISKLADLNFIDEALFVLDHTPSPSDFSRNSLIKAYTHNGIPHNALLLYLETLRAGFRPSNFTLTFTLHACSTLASIQEGAQVHADVFKMGFHSDMFVGNSLINMYCKCCFFGTAHEVFDEMPTRDEVSWNSIISGYIQCGEVEEARCLFDEMPLRKNVVCWTVMINGYGRKGNITEMLNLFRKMLLSADEAEPNCATMVCLLSSCSDLCCFEVGRWVSLFIDVNSFPLNERLCTALIDLHAKCGHMEKAQTLFNSSSGNSLACWNAMMTAYVQCGLLEEAIRLYHCMRATVLKPDEITMVNVLSASAGVGALELGRNVHLYLCRNGIEINVILATALIDMYSKCGKIDDACLVFVKACEKDVAMWNSMILGLAYHGTGRDSLAVFRQMKRQGFQPNDITFIGILSACNLLGLVEEGRAQFSNMIHAYGLTPKVEHYDCMVDLLGRAGHLEEAYELIQHMVVLPDSIIWGTLLGACRIHHNLKLADKIGRILTSSGDPNIGSCVLLSNIYASVGRWKDVAEMKRLVKERRKTKPSGWSWMEVGGSVHRFLGECVTHIQSEDIDETNRSLIAHLRDEGYVPNINFSLKNLDGL